MKLNNLKPAEGSTKTRKRVGRGQGSGRGGTSTRGHKGAKSRSGYSKKIGFEGGQMPLQRRVPKFGFSNPNRIEFRGINLDTLQTLVEATKAKKIDKQLLIDNGLAGKKDLIKVLGRGEWTSKVDVEADAFSKSAAAAIEKAGGKVTVLREEKPQVEKKTKSKPKAKAADKSEEAEKVEEAPAAVAEEETKEETPAEEVAEAPAEEDKG